MALHASKYTCYKQPKCCIDLYDNIGHLGFDMACVNMTYKNKLLMNENK